MLLRSFAIYINIYVDIKETPWTPLIFSQINSSHSMPLCFKKTQNSHRRALLLTSLAHTSGLRLVSFMSVSSSPHLSESPPPPLPPRPSHFSIMPPVVPATRLRPKQNQIIKGKEMQVIVMFVCFHHGQQFRCSYGSFPDLALTVYIKSLQKKKRKKKKQSDEPNLHLWAQNMYCKKITAGLWAKDVYAASCCLCPRTDVWVFVCRRVRVCYVTADLAED